MSVRNTSPLLRFVYFFGKVALEVLEPERLQKQQENVAIGRDFLKRPGLWMELGEVSRASWQKRDTPGAPRR
jgi:hypothetical protein